VEPNINSVEVHPQPTHEGRPVDGMLAGAGSLCFFSPHKSVLSHQSSLETNDLRGQLPCKDLAREFA